MKITKIICPNCNGQLDIPEGMKEGFVKCKFCNTDVYIEPHKPNITQNIHIDEVNYNKTREVPKRNSGFSPLLGILLSLLFLPSVLSLLVFNNIRSSISSNIPEAVASYCTVPEDETVVRFLENVFGKSVSDLSEEEYGSIQYLEIKKTSGLSPNAVEQWVFSYANSVDSFGEPIEKKTIILPSTKSIDKSSLQPFIGLVSLKLEEGEIKFPYDNTKYSQDLKNLSNLKYYSDQYVYAADLKRILPHPEEILGLSGVNFAGIVSTYYSQDNSEINLEKIMSEFTSLESLDVRVDVDYEGGLLFLRNLPGLKR